MSMGSQLIERGGQGHIGLHGFLDQRDQFRQRQFEGDRGELRRSIGRRRVGRGQRGARCRNRFPSTLLRVETEFGDVL